MPALRVLVGPSFDALRPISINDGSAHRIVSPFFDGAVSVHVKGLGGPPPPYFARPERAGVTWSIQVQGRFMQQHSADDVLFGNTFDRRLKLPWGSSAALKFMHFIDPTLEHDLTGDQPWALSPLVSTMPYLEHRTARASAPPVFPPRVSIGDAWPGVPRGKRRAHFSSRSARAGTTLGPHDMLTMDFAYGFITFPQLALHLPGGLSWDLTRYWDRHPLRFVCCERAPPEDAESDGASSGSSASSGSGSSASSGSGFGWRRRAKKDARGRGPGRVFWCVVIEAVDEEEEEEEDATADDIDE